MALSIIGTPGAAASTSITLPTHAVGDLIVICAFKDGATSVPTKPTASGTVPAWVTIDGPTGANSCAMICCQFKATATNHTSGTWTGATGMSAIVVRGQDPTTPIGGHAQGGSTGNGTTQAPTVTLTNSSGSSMLLHFVAHRTVTAWSAASAGYTRRASVATEIALNTKDTTTTAPANTQACTSTNSGYRGQTVEVLVAGPITGAADTTVATSLDVAGRNSAKGAADITVTTALDVAGDVEAPAVFPSTVVLDTFDRANNPLGGNWSNDTIGAGSTTINIVSSQIRASSAPYGEMWWNPAQHGPDCETFVTLVQESNGTDYEVTLMLRVQTPGSTAADGYRLRISNASGGEVVIQKVTNGAASALGSAISHAAVSGNRYGFTATGDTLTAWVNTGSGWTELGSRTDSTYTGAGYLSFSIYDGTSMTVPSILDDFGGGTSETGVAYRDRILSLGPVMYLRLNEASGTFAADATGTNHGAYVNAPGFAAAGAVVDSGTAVTFNGTDEYISVPDDATLDLTSTISIEFWIKTTHSGSEKTVLSKNTSGGGSSYAVRIRATGIPVLVKEDTSYDRDAAAAVNDGNWHHCVVTKNGSTRHWYIDGVLSDGAANTDADFGVNTLPLYVGTYQPTNGNLPGSLDEVALYNTALSAADVLENYETGAGIVPTEYGAADITVATTLDVAARNNARGAADITVGRVLDVAGRNHARAVVDTARTVTLDVAGRNQARAVVDTTVATSLDVAGRRIAKGAADTTATVDLAVAGEVEAGAATVTGAADITVATALDVAARNQARGAADITVGRTLDVAGRNAAKAAVDTTVAVDLAVDGDVEGEIRGHADHAATVTLDVAGRNRAIGAADTTIAAVLDVAARNQARAVADTSVLVDLSVAGLVGAPPVAAARTRTLMGVGM